MPHEPAEHNAQNIAQKYAQNEAPGRYPGLQPVPQRRGYYGYAGYPAHDLDDSLTLIRRGKWIIVLCIVAATAAAAVYTSHLTPEYEASTLVLVQPDRSGGLDVSPGGLIARGERSLTNELIVLRSSLPIARSVATRLLEMEREDLTIVRDGRDVGEIARRLQWNHIRVGSEGRDADVVRVTATSAGAEEAALLANLYSEEYVSLTQEASRTRITASRTFLEEQLSARFENLAAVEDAIQAYMTETGAFALDSEGESLVRQIGELEALRAEARVELQMRRASLRERENEWMEIYPQLSQGITSGLEAEVRSAQQQLVELELARNQLLLREGQAAPSEKLTDLSREIEGRRRQLDGLSKRYVDEVMSAGGVDLMSGSQGREHIADLHRQMAGDRVAISGLETKTEVLEARLREQEARLTGLPEQAIKLAQLQRDRQAAERTYADVAARLQELRIAEESELGYATIIREALVPAAPIRPNVRRNLALGLLAGTLLGVAGAAARRRRDRRLYSLDDARRATGSLIGAVPKMGREIRSAFGRKETVEVDGREIGTGVVTLLNGMSPAAEAFRHIRTNIQFSRPETVVQTVVVTSACPGEGKTTTAANIAVVMAQAGRRTLLLDADLRRPKVHRLFGRPSRKGLIYMLSNPEAALDLALTDTGIDDLHVLPVEEGVDNPSELLGSTRMRRLLQQLRQVYDVIVIDTPPVLAATDAALLATQCDATVVVARAGMTEMPELEHCMTLLGNVDAHVVGGVLNGFDPPRKYAYRYGAAKAARSTEPRQLPVASREDAPEEVAAEAPEESSAESSPPETTLLWHY